MKNHYWLIGAAIVLYLLYSNGAFKTTAAGSSATA